MENTPNIHSKPNTSLLGQQNTTLVEVVRIFLSRWRWFALSLIFAVIVAMAVVRTSRPQYVRTASVMIKETAGDKAAGNDLDAILSQQNYVSSKISNELVAFKSPTLMSEVVKRLGLETEYAIIGRAHKQVVYGPSVPVNVDFSGVNRGSIDEIKLEAVEGSETEFTVRRIEGYADGSRFKLRNSMKVSFGEEISTPAGPIKVTANEYSKLSDWTRPLLVTHRTNAATIGIFVNKLTVAPEDVKNRSDVITISVKDYNVDRAEDVIKMLYAVYNENWVEDRNRAATSASLFITDRLGSIEAELSSVDETISNFKSSNLMPDVNQAASSLVQQSSEFSQQARQLENQLATAKYFINYLTNDVGRDNLIPMPSGLGDNGISSQVTEYNRLVLQRNGIVSNSSVNNPLVIDMDRNLDALHSAMIESFKNQINQINVQLDIIVQREKQNENYIANSPNQAKTLMSYERQQKVKESLYLYLLQKREENELSKASTAYNTKIITQPFGSSAPVSPNASRIMLIAIFIGIAMPAGVLYLMVLSNNKVRGKKDLEDLPYPFIGEIPQKYVVGNRYLSLRKLLKKSKNENREVDIVVEAGSRDVINESFRVLRTNLEFMCKTTDHNLMILTSYNPGSGKTFVTINLSKALVLNKHKVLIVDGDFRRYSLSRTLKLNHGKGFSDYLSGNEQDVHPYIRSIDGLDVLPLGTVPPNPSELLSEGKFFDTMKALKQEYEYVLVDTAPVDIVADTQIMAPIADRTIFVVRAGLFERNLMGELIELGKDGKCSGITILLNGTEVNSVYGYRYGSKYAYHYGRYGHSYGYGYGYRTGGGNHYSHKSKEGYYSYDAPEPSKKKKK